MIFEKIACQLTRGFIQAGKQAVKANEVYS